MSYILEGSSINRSMRNNYFLIFLVFFLAVWAPSEKGGYFAQIEPVRYALHVFLVLILFLSGFNISRAKDAVGTLSGLSITAFILYFCISGAWTPDPIFALQRVVLFLSTFILILYVVSNYEIEEMFKPITMAFVLVVVLSFFVIFLVPSFGLEQEAPHQGKWRGIVSQKNPFGMVCAVTIFLLMLPNSFLPRIFASNKYVRASVIVICLISVIMSGSRGALGSLFLGFAWFCFANLPYYLRKFVFVVFLVALPVLVSATLMSFEIDRTIISLFGIEFDTSNRLLIWRFALSLFEGKEFFGFGFGGFWTPETEVRFKAIYGWVLPNYHSGYFGLLIEGGICGVFIFLLVIFSTLREVFKEDMSNKIVRLTSLGAYCVAYLSQNIYENNLLRSTNAFMILFFLIAVSLAVSRVRRRDDDQKLPCRVHR